jgi:hypothetical protein
MTPLRNAQNQVVAYENQPNPNRRELRSKSNGLLAWYDRNTDQTFDGHGKRVGFGDQTNKSIPKE